jgi:UDP-N-acetylmuramyl pentapeptide synthase
LITNIGREHLEFFGTLDGVARAETEVFDWLRKHGRPSSVVFLNRNEKYLVRHARNLRHIVSFGFGKGTSSVKGKVAGYNDLACARLEIVARSKKPFTVDLSVPGYHNAQNALAAAAVGLALKVPVGKIRSELSSFTSTSKRMQLLQVNGVTVLNDTYNANPDSTLAALGVLEKIQTKGKKIVVLADMLELGTDTAAEHRRIGEAVAPSGATHLLTFGSLSRNISDASATATRLHFDQKSMLLEHLIRLIAPGDVVLVKGSRGMKMEEVVSFLTDRYKQSNATPGQAA